VQAILPLITSDTLKLIYFYTPYCHMGQSSGKTQQSEIKYLTYKEEHDKYGISLYNKVPDQKKTE
jgi:hypothetical protein